MAPVVTLRQLLEAGVHFGHQTRRWNPKMKRFIYGERAGIYIIDLEKTLDHIATSYAFVRDMVADGGTLLFVGTKKQAKDSVQSYAERCGMPYINERWLGGMLTNFETISKRVNKMKDYQRMRVSGEFEAMPKKEALLLGRELDKLERNLGGIRNMEELPERRVRARHQEGAHRGHRGQQARHSRNRRGRHQLRPRHRELRDSRQRRCHPLGRAHVSHHVRRRRRGSLHPPGALGRDRGTPSLGRGRGRACSPAGRGPRRSGPSRRRARGTDRRRGRCCSRRSRRPTMLLLSKPCPTDAAPVEAVSDDAAPVEAAARRCCSLPKPSLPMPLLPRPSLAMPTPLRSKPTRSKLVRPCGGAAETASSPAAEAEAPNRRVDPRWHRSPRKTSRDFARPPAPA